MKRDSDRLEPIVDESVKAIHRVLTGSATEENDITAARLAGSVLATWAKLKQSERASDAMHLSAAQMLAKDSDELKKYISITLPDMPVVKQLPEPKKK